MPTIRVLPALVPLALAFAPLGAQQASCPVDLNQPAVLTQAFLGVNRARQADSASAPKALRDAMRPLQDAKKWAANPVGAGFLKAQIYVLWMLQPGTGETLTNEELNAGGVKTATVDLVMTTDSLLKAVEALGPGCADETLPWRYSKAWNDRINKAYQALSADQADSAGYWLDRAAALYPSSPFISNARAQLANKRGDTPAMMGYLRQAITESAADTSLAETLKQLRFQLATTAKDYAMTGGAAQKDALNKEALELFTLLLDQNAGSNDGAYAFSAASEIVQVSQDSSAIRTLLAPIVAAPVRYTDLTLLMAADLARASSRSPDAIALYAGALARNPFMRDANYFLAYLYYEAKDAAKMLPLTDRLIELDPSNGDNYLMRAYAFQLMAQAERDVRKKQDLIKQQDAMAARETQLSSLHKVVVNRFERREAGAVLGGVIENLSRAAKAYSLTVEFLDASGTVLETMTSEVPSVAAGQRGTFEVTATKPGVAAFRYQPLPVPTPATPTR